MRITRWRNLGLLLAITALLALPFMAMEAMVYCSDMARETGWQCWHVLGIYSAIGMFLSMAGALACCIPLLYSILMGTSNNHKKGG